MPHKMIWGADLYKGFKLPKSDMLSGSVNDILPFQMLTMEEKTIDWIKAVADYYEMCGWNNVERKAGKIERNYKMRQGILNPSDYIIHPDNQFHQVIGMVVPQESQSPLEQFYPLAPNFVDVLRGEFIKRDNQWTIEAVDPYSVAEAFEFKRSQFEQIIMQQTAMMKQQTLAQMGLTEDVDPEKYAQEMQQAMTQLTEVELKSKNFRTVGVKWAEKVLKIQDKRYALYELEPDAFESGLITDSEFWHLDMMEDDFKVELLNPKWCDYHKGPNVKYVSDGDYFLWFDFMSAGDIVNKFGRRMKEEDMLKLKDIYVKTSNLLVVDQLKNRQGAYYDMTKPWSQATDLNPVRNDALLGKELAYNYLRTPNFDHNMEVDLFNPVYGRMVTGHPQMFRVMRLYWRSMKRIGWLTKIERDGTVIPPDWVDENFKVTVEPQYDNSVVKEKTKDNLLYGEHVDWQWVPDWRHVMKISPNQKHSFWLNAENTLESIYIDGGPIPFQFKGRNNPFDSLPPVEGCTFSHINSTPHSFIDRIRPLQIIYNICMNKVPRKFLADYGNKVVFDRRGMSLNNLDNATKGVDPLEAYEDKLRNSDILDYSFTRESLEGLGQPGLPQVLQLSTVQEAQMYFQLGQMIKWEAGELIGITRNRLGQNKASETATGINQAITYSETQTEKYYEQHANLMQRFRQRMLDAAQYYSAFQESSRELYMNEMDENVFLDITGLDNLLPHYNIYLQSRANVRSALQTISQFLIDENTLPIKASAKVEAIVNNSIPQILSLIKKSEFEQEQMELQKQQMEQATEQQRLQQQTEAQLANIQHEDMQKELDRRSAERIATIRAEGGLQSDINANGVIDSAENLDPYLKQQEILNNKNIEENKLLAKKQTDTNQMIIAREKARTELEKEKIKQEGALKVAKENKTAAELKKKKSD